MFFVFCVFVIYSYQYACYGCENAENQTWSEFFMTDRGVCKREWHNVRSYLFFNVQKFPTLCAMTLTVIHTELKGRMLLELRDTGLFLIINGYCVHQARVTFQKWFEEIESFSKDSFTHQITKKILSYTFKSLGLWFYIYIYIYAFSRRFYPKRLTLHSSYSFTFYQLLLSLGNEPMILALLAPCSTIWATGKPVMFL